MALPTDAKVDLLVCDTIRQESDGKLNLFGLFPTGEVQIDPTAKPPFTLNLTFTFILKDGDGHFRTSLQILDPIGQELHKGDLPDIDKPGDKGHSLSATINAIPIKNFGHYSVILMLDGQPYRRTVRIFQ